MSRDNSKDVKRRQCIHLAKPIHAAANTLQTVPQELQIPLSDGWPIIHCTFYQDRKIGCYPVSVKF
jgi:hypothetical protein